MMEVIVADDEFLARKALVKMLEKVQLPIEICGECENGREVVELMEKAEADLIITDIRMPGMDGIKLAEYVGQQEWDTDIIIETGYADFQYAQNAIRYGVKEYLVKPLNEQELCESIRKVLRERQKKIIKDSLRLLDFSYILQNEKLYSQVLGWYGGQEQEPYCMILANGKDEAGNESFLKEWLEKYAEFSEIRSFFFEAKNECILLAFGKKEQGLESVFALRAQQELERCWPQNVWISFSRWHTGEKELEQAYRECVYGMNERILRKKRIFFYKPRTEFREIVPREQEQLLQDAVERGAEKEAGEIIKRVFEEAQKEDGNVYSFFAALMRIFFVLNRVCYQKTGNENSQGRSSEYLCFDFKMDLYQFYDLEGIRKYVEMLLKEACRKDAETENLPMIQNLLDYLERNYAYDISLGELAERRYFVSSSHLSRLFKAYTGQPFVKYLIGLRMEKAKNFLECSQMEISDIAACVGYNDPSHFTQTFRRTYGMSPKEYRRQVKENKR